MLCLLAVAVAALSPERLSISGSTVSEPGSTAPLMLRGFNLDFKLGGDFPNVSAEDRALGTLLPGTNLVRLVMNHWHDQSGSGDCSSSEGPDYIRQECLDQFDGILGWSTGELGAWSVITARSASAAGDGGPGATIFNNATLKSEWLAMWGALARRYANMTKIAGYEVMSEPRTNSPATLVHSIQQEACDAVWQHDPQAVCLVGASEFYNRYNPNATYLVTGGPVIYAVSQSSACCCLV